MRRFVVLAVKGSLDQIGKMAFKIASLVMWTRVKPRACWRHYDGSRFWFSGGASSPIFSASATWSGSVARLVSGSITASIADPSATRPNTMIGRVDMYRTWNKYYTQNIFNADMIIMTINNPVFSPILCLRFFFLSHNP